MKIECATCEHKRQYAMGLLYHAYDCALRKERELIITRNVNRDVFTLEKERPDDCPLVKP